MKTDILKKVFIFSFFAMVTKHFSSGLKNHLRLFARLLINICGCLFQVCSQSRS